MHRTLCARTEVAYGRLIMQGFCSFQKSYSPLRMGCKTRNNRALAAKNVATGEMALAPRQMSELPPYKL